MSLVGAVAVFFIIWWLCLFAVLPFGVRSRNEGDEAPPGADPGAPTQPNLVRSAIATTLLAAIIFLGVYLYFQVYELNDLLP